MLDESKDSVAEETTQAKTEEVLSDEKTRNYKEGSYSTLSPG